MADLEKAVLAAIDATGALEDTGPFAEAHATDNATIVGLIKSLESAEMITVTVRSCFLPHLPCIG